MALKTKRITEDTDLDAILDEPGWVPVSPERILEIHEAAKQSFALRQGGISPAPSLWSRMSDLVLDGDALPADLSSNKAHLKNYGRSRSSR